MSVGAAIGSYLKENGIKQTFLADKVGMPDAKMSAIINQGQRIEVVEYYKICKALDVPFEKFLVDAVLEGR